MAKFTAKQLLDHLYNKRLPQVYREADSDANLCLKRFLQSIVEGGYAEALTSADGIVDLTDPLKCPDNIFPLLFSSFGYKYSVDIPMLYQRKILQNHGELFQKRGTIEYIYVLARILTGFDCDATIQRVDGVRVLTVTLFVDNSVTAVESQQYVNLVKRFVKEGYIPFYLDVDTNIVVDVVDVPVAQQYIGSAVDVEGITDISPITTVSERGLVTTLSPSIENEPFTQFNILGYSRIVPKYLNPNLINPNTVTFNAKTMWYDSDTQTLTPLPNMSILTELIYVPYGNKLYFNLVHSTYKAPTVYIFVFTSFDKTFVDNRVLDPTSFVDGKAQLDLSDVLINFSCNTDYYVQIGIINNENVPNSELPKFMSAWVEDADYSTYSAGTRFKFDNEYYKNGEAYPIYMADVYDSNGAISFPYCSNRELKAEINPEQGSIYMENISTHTFTAYTDCTTAIKDARKYYISFILRKNESNTLASPTLTALCTNSKGTYKKVILTKEVERLVDDNYRYGYSFTVPKDFNVVRVEYTLCNASNIGESVMLTNVMCFECDAKTGKPYIDTEFQPYTPSNDLNIYKNTLSVGIDGIPLLSYNNLYGEVIVRDSFDVLTATITRRVGVNYDSLGNPTGVYKLTSPYKEVIKEDFNGEIKAVPLTTFIGKTYVSMSQSVPYSRYMENGGANYHSCFELTTQVIK